MPEMPCPRFEFRWEKEGDSWKKRQCVYSIVFPLGEWDIRREGENGADVRNEWAAEIGRTRVDLLGAMLNMVGHNPKQHARRYNAYKETASTPSRVCCCYASLDYGE